MSYSFRPHGLYSPWNFPGQNTGVCSFSLLQGIFQTQGSNPGLPHCRRILYQLSYKGSPKILEWVADPFSSGSSQPRNQTRVSCTVSRFFTNWSIRDTIALTIWTFDSKVVPLLFNMLSRFVIAFLPISWLQSPSAVTLEPKEIKSVTASTVSPSICYEVMGLDAMILVFWLLRLFSATCICVCMGGVCVCVCSCMYTYK